MYNCYDEAPAWNKKNECIFLAITKKKEYS